MKKKKSKLNLKAKSFTYRSSPKSKAAIIIKKGTGVYLR
jgi:hypothetical protein